MYINILIGVTCDWAYWYIPDQAKVRPARVTVRSSRSVAGSGPVTAGALGSKHRSRSRDFKPWRSGMRKTASVPVVADEKNIVEKPLPEKPWRANMRKDPKPETEPQPDPKPKPEERAWRNNMRKEKPPEPAPVPVKVSWSKVFDCKYLI